MELDLASSCRSLLLRCQKFFRQLCSSSPLTRPGLPFFLLPIYRDRTSFPLKAGIIAAAIPFESIQQR